MATTLFARFSTVALLAFAAFAPGCMAASDEDASDDELAEVGEDGLNKTIFAGKNGSACMESAYNCKLRAKGGQVIMTSSGKDNWAVKSGEHVLDGNGESMGVNTFGHLKFNYGVTRRFNNRTYVYSRSSTVGSSGWFPIDAVLAEDSLRKKVGEVNAKDTDGERLGCYAIKDSFDKSIELKKVVYDAKTKNERLGDYLPRVRKSGRRYANLAHNVPGYGLGGPAIDIWPSGTKFQRVDVPTKNGKPSITIPLWVKASNGTYTKRSGSTKFIYGYVTSKTGTRRFGWMTLDALKTSTGCK